MSIHFLVQRELGNIFSSSHSQKEVPFTVLGFEATPGLTLLCEGLCRPSQPQAQFIPKEPLGKCPDKRRVIGDNHNSQESQILFFFLLFIWLCWVSVAACRIPDLHAA